MNKSDRKVIGVTGRIGAGKSSFIKELLLQLPPNSEQISIGSLLKARLVASGLPTAREHLSELATSLREQLGPSAIVDIVREKIEKSNCHYVVVDGVRGLRMRDLIREYKNGILVAIVADFDIRYKRVTSRPEKPDEANMTKNQFLELDEKEYSKELGILEAEADIRIENNSSYADLVQKIQPLARQPIVGS